MSRTLSQLSVRRYMSLIEDYAMYPKEELALEGVCSFISRVVVEHKAHVEMLSKPL